MLWHGRHLLVSTLRKTRWKADQADEILGIADVDVAAIVAVHGAGIPWGRVQADGITVIPGPTGARTAAGAASNPRARAGGVASRPGPAAVPPGRVTVNDQGCSEPTTSSWRG